MNILTVSGLVRHFRGVRAIDGVDLDLGEGQCLGLIGPNGAGKSTLFRMMTGLLKADAGTILFRGRDVTSLSSEDRYRLGLAWSFQHPRCFPTLTPREHLEIARAHRATDSVEAPDDVDKWLAAVGLLDHADTAVGHLSIAERKLLDFARAASSHPRLLLLDEPFASLSREQARRIADAAAAVCRRGATLVVIEHRLPELLELVDEIAVLADGRMIHRGPPAEALRAPEVLNAYFGIQI